MNPEAYNKYLEEKLLFSLKELDNVLVTRPVDTSSINSHNIQIGTRKTLNEVIDALPAMLSGFLSGREKSSK